MHKLDPPTRRHALRLFATVPWFERHQSRPRYRAGIFDYALDTLLTTQRSYAIEILILAQRGRFLETILKAERGVASRGRGS